MTNAPSDFWSRRRAQVAAEEAAEARAVEDAARAATQAEAEDRSDEEVLAELDLPVPEEMESPEQVQSLLKAVAPQRLKTRALRRLWRLNPVLANVDGLVDYGEDYTDAALVVENLQTIYQVGKGMFDKAVQAAEDKAAAQARAEAKALAKAEEAKAEAAQEQSDEAPDHVRGDAAPDAVHDAVHNAERQTETAPDPAPGPPVHAPEIAETSAAPRRMRFRFEAAT